jgi:RNA polymerase sigma-70 factor (ECF subfamily)
MLIDGCCRGDVYKELSLTATEPTVGRDQFALELERVFEQHYQFVYRTAYILTGSVADAEDITQTIFMRLLAREFPPDLQRNPEPYLYRAAFNLSLNTIRQRKRHVLTDNIELLDQRMGASGLTADELDRRLHEAIAELNPAATQILILRYVHNYSLADIARLMGTTRSTVAVSLFRSRARLKKLVRAWWENK